MSEENSCKMAEAVIDEVKTTLELNSLDDDFLKEIVDIPKADVAMGKMGVGSLRSWRFLCSQKNCRNSFQYRYSFIGKPF